MIVIGAAASRILARRVSETGGEMRSFMAYLGKRWPFLCLYGMILLSNVAGSAFSFMYNVFLIVNRILDDSQQAAFWNVGSPLYNVIAYPIALVVMMIMFQPLRR